MPNDILSHKYGTCAPVLIMDPSAGVFSIKIVILLAPEDSTLFSILICYNYLNTHDDYIRMNKSN